MNEATLTQLTTDTIKALRINADVELVESYLLDGEFELKTITGLEELDLENRDIRKYLINYSRYAYYGIIEEFATNYRELTRRIQIEAGI